MLHTKSKIVTVPETEFAKFWWLRCTRLFQLRVVTTDGKIVMFNGFQRTDYESITSTIRSLFGKNLEQKRQGFQGWNWGNLELQDSSLEFSVNDQLVFDVMLGSLSNSSVVSKNEISLEFRQAQSGDVKGRKTPDDMIVEMRFFVPNTAHQQSNSLLEKSAKLSKLNQEDYTAQNSNAHQDYQSDDNKNEDHSTEQLTPAFILAEAIKQRAGFTGSVGEPILSIGDLLCLTPRGRFELEVHPGFFRLRGKSHDYKIFCSAINGIYSLPKPDEVHHFFVISLSQPLLHGQTRYPYLVFHLEADNEVEITVDPQESSDKNECTEKLKKSYNGPAYAVLEEIVGALSDVKVVRPTGFRGSQQRAGIKCAYKANEAFLFPLEKSTLSLVKPVTNLLHSEVVSVKFSRVGITSNETFKTFEIVFSMANGREYFFTSIAREEYFPLEQFYKSKRLKVVTESMENSSFAGRKIPGSFGDTGYRDSKRSRGGDGSPESAEMEQNSSDMSDYVAGSESSDAPEEYDENYKSDSDGSSGSD